MTANMKLAEAERALGVSRWTLYRYIRQGRLPVVRLAGGHYRVSAEAIDALQTLRADAHAGIASAMALPTTEGNRGR